MYAWFWFWLFTILRFRVPAIIKKHEQWFDVMTGSNAQKSVDPFFESFSIIFPDKVMKKNTKRVESNSLRPTQFPVDDGCVKTLRLPHFELVNGGTRQKITPH